VMKGTRKTKMTTKKKKKITKANNEFPKRGEVKRIGINRGKGVLPNGP